MALHTKRGQSAAGAAVFLAIIAGLLIMFIVLMPPADRAELLGDSSPSGTVSSSSGASNLLITAPGKIDYMARKEMEHPLPVIQVYTQAESQVLAEKNLVYARRTLINHEESIFPFSVQDLTNTQNIILNFKVNSVEGRLMILLNGEPVFNAPVDSGAGVPVVLPKSMLKNDNELTFAASSPGLAFWATNEVSLEEAKVVAEVTNLEGQYSKNVFLTSETEKRNLDRVVLKFQPECNPNEAGKLRITLNNNEIYNALPDCALSMVPIEIAPSLLKEDENVLVFQVDKGRYILSHVVVETKLKELDFPTYYFSLSHETYGDIKNGTYDARLKMDFTDVGDNKYGDILINGHYYGYDTKDISIAMNISADVVQGNNAVKIKPRKTVEVRELRVDLVKS
ncbi:MAG: hypothetical protein WCV90_03675 [Candidatus Woesearchaeota archaeon]